MNRKIALIFSIVTLIIILCGAYFIWHHNKTQWEPNKKEITKQNKDIHIAIVNEDIPVKQGDTTLAFGEDFAKEVVQKNEHAEIVNRASALDGLKEGLYQVMILIPDDFSNNATSFSTKNPKKLNLSFKYNTENNKQLALQLEKFTSDTASAYNNKLIKIYFGSVIQNMMNAQKNIEKTYDNHQSLQQTFNHQLLVPIAEFGTNFIDYGAFSQQSNSIISTWNSEMSNVQNNFRAKLLGINTTPIDEKVQSVIALDARKQQEQSNVLKEALTSHQQNNATLMNDLQSIITQSKVNPDDTVMPDVQFNEQLDRFFEGIATNTKHEPLTMDEQTKQKYEDKVREALAAMDNNKNKVLDDIVANEKLKQDELKLKVEESIVKAINTLPTHNIDNVSASHLPDDVKNALISAIHQSQDFQQSHPDYQYTYGDTDLTSIGNDTTDTSKAIPVKITKVLNAMQSGQLTMQLDPKFSYNGSVTLNGSTIGNLNEGLVTLGQVPANAVLTIEGEMIPQNRNAKESNHRFIIEGKQTKGTTEAQPTTEQPVDHQTTEQATGEPATHEAVTTEPATKAPQTTPSSERPATTEQQTPAVPTSEQPNGANASRKNAVKQMTMEKLNDGNIKVIQVVKQNDAQPATTQNDHYYYEFNEHVLLGQTAQSGTQSGFTDFTAFNELFNIYNQLSPSNTSVNPEAENIDLFVQLLTDEIYGPINGQIEQFNQQQDVLNQSVDALKEEKQRILDDYLKAQNGRADSQEQLATLGQTMEEKLNQSDAEPLAIDLDKSEDETNVTLSLSEDINHLMQDSLQLLDQSEQSRTVSSEIEHQLSSLKHASNDIESKGKQLSEKATHLNQVMEQNLKSEETFKNNFTKSFENAERNGQPNEALKHFIGMPLDKTVLDQVKNEIPTEKKFDGPIYIVLFIYLFSLLIAYCLQSYEDTNHITQLFNNKYKVMTPLKHNLVMTAITLIAGLILSAVASCIAIQQLGITEHMMVFIALITITAITFTVFNTFLLRQLRSIGMLLSLIILSFYLLSIEGLSQFKSGLLNTAYSPLSYVDRMFFNYLSGELSIALTVTMLIAVAIIFTALNVVRKQFKNQVMI
ncbi:type VII secretion protein EsaA [Macrococcus capreoli]|uniref:type VII secretion protein EsaA n=1 Tax=Macrococcus capreoli TaxID=2982690 RepID=UPI0021D57016|nr:type VII secretion protein EsaA [Macrococcus sp. TMW 2.2395]MCU7557226.1 type VII secretion protein EsaA [Macrococcus sp. TMW 2.2395]